jgi:hypothetical protein
VPHHIIHHNPSLYGCILNQHRRSILTLTDGLDGKLHERLGLSDNQVLELSKEVVKSTGGVPRLVHLTLSYLLKNPQLLQTSIVQVSQPLFHVRS